MNHIGGSSGFDIMTFYLVVSITLLALLGSLVIKSTVSYRRMIRIDREFKERVTAIVAKLDNLDRTVAETRMSVVYAAEEIKTKLDLENITRAVIEEKATRKAEEIIKERDSGEN